MATVLDAFRHRPPRSPPRPAAAKVRYLTETDIFRDLGPADLAELDRMTAMTTCRRGRLLYEPGATGEVLFILKRGRVHLYRLTADGRKLITATIEPGTIFGEMASIGQAMEGSYAEAAEDCTLCALSRADLEHLLATHPSVALRLIGVLAARLAAAEARLETLAFKRVPARLAAVLLRLSKEGREELRGVTHQELAEMVGPYRETATAILDEFRGQGLVELHRLRIRVLDPAGLRTVLET